MLRVRSVALSVLLLAGALTVPTLHADHGESVVNGDFETGDETGWTRIGEGPLCEQGPMVTPYSTAWHVTDLDPTRPCGLSQTVLAHPDELYYLSFLAASTMGQARLDLTWLDANGAILGSETIRMDSILGYGGPHYWWDAELVSPSGTAAARIDLGVLDDLAADDAAFEDISLIAMGTPPPPPGESVVNGDFETGDETGWTRIGEGPLCEQGPLSDGPLTGYRTEWHILDLDATGPCGLSQTVPAHADEFYSLSLLAGSTLGQARLDLTWLDATGGALWAETFRVDAILGSGGPHYWWGTDVVSPPGTAAARIDLGVLDDVAVDEATFDSVSLLAMGAPPPPPAPPPREVRNGGFEEGWTSWSQWGWDGRCQHEVTNAWAAEGAQSMRVADLNDTASCGVMQAVAASPGDLLDLSAAFNVVSGVVHLKLEFVHESGFGNTQIHVSTEGMGEQTLSVGGTAPSGTIEAWLWFYEDVASTSEAYADAFVLSRVDA